jgi:hypothetical protein
MLYVRALLATAGLAAVLLALAGCPTQSSDPPVITSVDGSRVIRARDSAWFACNAYDPQAVVLEYAWQVTEGRLGWSWGRYTHWFAPDTSSEAVLHVTVTDNEGLKASETLTICVLAETLGVMFWDGAVKAHGHASWPDTVRARYRLFGKSGAMADTSGDVFLMLMDDTNYTKWTRGEPALALKRVIAYKADTFSAVVPDSGVYRLVIDNTERGEDYHFWVNLWKAGP